MQSAPLITFYNCFLVDNIVLFFEYIGGIILSVLDYKNIFVILMEYQRKIQSFSEQGQCLTVDDISPIFNLPILRESNILCIANIDSKLIPSLSLSYFNREVQYHNNVQSLKELIRSLKDKIVPAESILLEHNYKTVNYHISASFPYYFSLPDSDRLKICARIGTICDIVLGSSLHIKNYERDNTINKFDMLKLLLKSNNNFSLYDLSNFIIENENYSILPIDVHSLLSIQFSKDLIRSNPHKLSSSILNQNSKLFKNRIRYQLAETTKTGKVFSGCISDDVNNCYYAIIPVIRKKENPTHITSIVMIYRNMPLYLNEIDDMIDYVDLFVSYGMISRKLNMSISIQQDILNMSHNNPSITINNYSDFYTELKLFLKPLLSEILKTTYASIASVRIYEPNENSLILLINVLNENTETDSISLNIEDKPFKLKNYRSNATAFTFLVGNTYYDYVYINNCNSKIPIEYKDHGLDSDFKDDKDIKSKLFFPLLSQNVPFGVLIIEAKVKKAFDDIDINYIKTLKKAIEAYYNNLLHLNDMQWIKTQINHYENIHELKNLIETKYFNQKTKQLLRRYLYTRESEYHNNIKKDIILMERYIKIWISQMYCNLTSKSHKKIASIVNYQFEENDLTKRLSNDFIDSIQVILKNLILNVVRYGHIDRDRISISNKPFLKFGESCEIRIFMRSYGPVGTDLEKLGIAPIYDSSNIPHFGMFLVGMLTRILGGTISVSKKEMLAYHIIEIRIPLHGG